MHKCTKSRYSTLYNVTNPCHCLPILHSAMARKKLYANNAERQAAYRAKRDAEKRSQHRANERSVYIAKKRSGKAPLVENMSNRERRAKRKDWQRASRRYRLKQKREKYMTPPTTPEDGTSVARHGESSIRRVGRKSQQRQS